MAYRKITVTGSQSHIEETFARISASPVVEKITDMETHNGNNYGYIHIRMIMSNGDFLEVAEYFVIQDGKICVSRYRYQWMNSTQQVLKKRWDNTKHFPKLQNFPHHIHIESETYVVPGWELSIIELLDLLEKDIF